MRSYITAEEQVAELTLRSILLAILLTVILAVSNAYLALKLGILTSASIPAAILSMGILRFFKTMPCKRPLRQVKPWPVALSIPFLH